MTHMQSSLKTTLWLNAMTVVACADQSEKPTLSPRFENYGIGNGSPWKL